MWLQPTISLSREDFAAAVCRWHCTSLHTSDLYFLPTICKTNLSIWALTALWQQSNDWRLVLEAMESQYQGEKLKYKKSSPEQNVADYTTEAVSVQRKSIAWLFFFFLFYATIDFGLIAMPQILYVGILNIGAIKMSLTNLQSLILYMNFVSFQYKINCELVPWFS